MHIQLFNIFSLAIGVKRFVIKLHKHSKQKSNIKRFQGVRNMNKKLVALVVGSTFIAGCSCGEGYVKVGRPKFQ